MKHRYFDLSPTERTIEEPAAESVTRTCRTGWACKAAAAYGMLKPLCSLHCGDKSRGYGCPDDATFEKWMAQHGLSV